MLGSSNLTATEAALPNGHQVVFLHHGKSKELLREIIHQIGATRVVTPTCGGGPLVDALLEAGVKGLLLCRSDAHTEFLREHAMIKIRNMSADPSLPKYYLS